MSRIIKVLTLSAMLVVGVFAMGASAASAAPSDSLTCAFRGLAGIANPGVENVQSDVADNTGNPGYGDPAGATNVVPGVVGFGDHGLTVNLPSTPLDPILDRDLGTYNYGGDSTCVHLDVDNPTNSRVATVHVDSAGSYADTICGTGSAWSTNATNIDTANSTTLVGVPGGPATDVDKVSGVNYNINFVGGEGPLLITAATVTDGQGGTHSGVPGAAGAGFVNIAPHGLDPSGDGTGGDCGTTSVSKFSVAGAFTSLA